MQTDVEGVNLAEEFQMERDGSPFGVFQASRKCYRCPVGRSALSGEIDVSELEWKENTCLSGRGRNAEEASISNTLIMYTDVRWPKPGNA